MQATGTMFASAALLAVFAVVIIILIGLYINFIRPLSVTFIFGFSYTKFTSEVKLTHYQMELADSGNVDQQQIGDAATA